MEIHCDTNALIAAAVVVDDDDGGGYLTMV